MMPKSKVPLLLSLLFCCVGFGCAGPAVRPDALQITVSPEQIYPGCVVALEVKAPPGSREMQARLDLFGSPVVPLKSEDRGKTWVFRTQIPLEAAWQPGRYKIVVQGQDANGFRLQGETWIIAP